MPGFGQKHLGALDEVRVGLAVVGVRYWCALRGLELQRRSLSGLDSVSHRDGAVGKEAGIVPAASSRHPKTKQLLLLCRGGEGWWGCPRSEPVPHHTSLQLCFPSRRIFVLGIGFFTLCFLMTSLGGQFSAKRLGDSPFTIRTEGKRGSMPVLSHVKLNDPHAHGPAELTSARDAGRMVLRCLHSQGSLLTHFRDVRTAQGPVGPSCCGMGHFAAMWLKPGCVHIQRCTGTVGTCVCWSVDADPGSQKRAGKTPVTGADRIRPSTGGGGVSCMGCNRSDVPRIWLGCLGGSVVLGSFGLQGLEIVP